MSANIFLKTLNNLSSRTNSSDEMDAETVRKFILDRLQQAPSTLRGLSELPIPISIIEQALAALIDLGLVLVERKAEGSDEVYRLADYAIRALRAIPVSA